MEPTSVRELAMGHATDGDVPLSVLEIPEWRRLATKDSGAATYEPSRQPTFGRNLGDVHLCRAPRPLCPSTPAEHHEQVGENARGGTADCHATGNAVRHVVSPSR